MTTIFLGALLAGAIFFLWSAISWMALPWQRAQYKSFADEDAVAKMIASQSPQSGMYGLPAEPKYPPGATKEQRDKVDTAVWERLQKGPTVTAIVKQGGIPSFPQMLIVAFITYAAVAFLFGWMLAQTSGLSYLERVAFVTIAGIAAGIVCRLPDWNWHQYPTGYTVVQIANLAIGWCLAGLALAWIIRGHVVQN
ncbi:MAG: hypothetical protein HY287_07835 [Planctomycetes bacterium]|nr:hypothetical protein [Planctomycetota bacterium]MBI3834222.1 hypothetical protein [Planctomycetota bacterium]